MSCETGAPYISLRSVVDGVGSVIPATPPPGAEAAVADPRDNLLVRWARAISLRRRKRASAC